MPETSIEEIGPHGPAEASEASEPSPTVGRSETGQFVKVTHRRPVADPGPPRRRDREWTDLETPPSDLNPEQLVLPVPENRPITPAARMRLLHLLAPRVWRR